MAQLHVLAGRDDATPIEPAIRTIGFADLRDALAKGFDDFWAMPSHVIFIGLIYAVVGLMLGRIALGYDVIPLLFPLAAGFALVGPFAALGLYEMSRRRERGLDVSWQHAFDVLHSPSRDAIVALGLVLMAIFIVWLIVAQSLYASLFDVTRPVSPTQFLHEVIDTPAGHTLIVVGNGVGFLFAVLVLTISVVSFPMLLDREVGVVRAMRTSVRAVVANPVTMAAWGLIVAVALAIGSLPLFFGLAIVLPVLAHATWHLYRKVVAD